MAVSLVASNIKGNHQQITASKERTVMKTFCNENDHLLPLVEIMSLNGSVIVSYLYAGNCNPF